MTEKENVARVREKTKGETIHKGFKEERKGGGAGREEVSVFRVCVCLWFVCQQLTSFASGRLKDIMKAA